MVPIRSGPMFSAMSRQLRQYVTLGLLFVVCLAAFTRLYGYVIGFQSDTNDCFFLFGRPFLLEFLDHPAGPLRYAGRFLGQFYHHTWLGALVASACITCFGFLFYRVLVKLGESVPAIKTLVPCVLLLGLQTSTFCLLSDTLGLCTSCGAFLGYLSLRGKPARWGYALVATPPAYVVLGVYVWFLTAWILIFELLNGPGRRRLLFAAGYLVYAAAVPLAAWRWVYQIPLSSALVCPIMFAPPFRTGSSPDAWAKTLDIGLAASLSASVLWIPFWDRLCSGTRAAAFLRAAFTGWRRIAVIAALPVLAVLFHVVRYDASLADVVDCRRLYKLEKWDALLDRAKNRPSEDVRLQFMMNAALCHQGRLLDEMFHYPQTWGPRGLVLTFSGAPGIRREEDDTARAMYNSDLFYEIGHVNAAYHHAYNAYSTNERTYEFLERMAECSMVKGNYDLAHKYLNLLERTLFHRDFARRYKTILADPNAAEDEFRERRERLPDVDEDMFGHPTAPFFNLLHRNPKNRMAFDYLTGWLLLHKKRESITRIGMGIDYFRLAGYDSIPTHCQEALILKERAEHTRVDLRGFAYDEAVLRRVDGFFADLTPYWGRPSAMPRARMMHGDSYMFYYFFVTTPSEAKEIRETERRLGGTLRQE